MKRAVVHWHRGDIRVALVIYFDLGMVGRRLVLHEVFSLGLGASDEAVSQIESALAYTNSLGYTQRRSNRNETADT